MTFKKPHEVPCVFTFFRKSQAERVGKFRMFPVLLYKSVDYQSLNP